LGCYDMAIASCDEILSFNDQDACAHYNKACYLALAGRLDEALVWLERALGLSCNHHDHLDLAQRDSDFDALRGNPEFERIIAIENAG
jgi:tetratricopeptide (TPR) repeat protein